LEENYIANYTNSIVMTKRRKILKNQLLKLQQKLPRVTKSS
jgi:hypothetical protein